MKKILNKIDCRLITAILFAFAHLSGACTFTDTTLEVPAYYAEETPFFSGGVIINQTYGSGPRDNTGSISHSFVKLYNPTDSEISLAGFSLQIQNGINSDSPSFSFPPVHTGTEWEKFNFADSYSVAPYSSFLVAYCPVHIST